VSKPYSGGEEGVAGKRVRERIGGALVDNVRLRVSVDVAASRV